MSVSRKCVWQIIGVQSIVIKWKYKGMWIPLNWEDIFPSMKAIQVELDRHLEASFLVAMVAYCLNCVVVNIFNSNTNSVSFTVAFKLLCLKPSTSHWNSGHEKTTQRNSPVKDVLPNILLLTGLQEMGFCLTCPQAPAHLLCLSSFLDHCQGLLWLFEPCLGPGI